jgi:hypothetical protein
LQAIKDIPIYAKTIKELCIKKTGRKKKDPQTMQVIGKLADLMSGKIYMQKYEDPGSPIVKIHINNVAITNTLIDLGATINVMTKYTMDKLQLSNLRNTPTILQLVDRSTIKPKGVLEDIIVSLDSWEYPVDFMVLQSKSNLGGHPLILGRPWLATTDAFISCRSGDMTIAHGDSIKKFNLYPPAKALTESEFTQCFQETNDNEEIVQPILTIDQIMNFKNDIEENQIINFINNYDFTQYHGGQYILIINISWIRIFKKVVLWILYQQSHNQCLLVHPHQGQVMKLLKFSRKNLKYQF